MRFVDVAGSEVEALKCRCRAGENRAAPVPPAFSNSHSSAPSVPAHHARPYYSSNYLRVHSTLIGSWPMAQYQTSIFPVRPLQVLSPAMMHFLVKGMTTLLRAHIFISHLHPSHCSARRTSTPCVVAVRRDGHASTACGSPATGLRSCLLAAESARGTRQSEP